MLSVIMCHEMCKIFRLIGTASIKVPLLARSGRSSRFTQARQSAWSTNCHAPLLTDLSARATYVSRRIFRAPTI